MTDMTEARIRAVRERLLGRRRELEARQQRVQHDLARASEPLVADFPDRALQTANDPVLEEIDEAALSEMAEIDVALARLDEGRYGICRNCHASIDPRRLAAVPHAVTCVPCTMAQAALAR